MGRVLVGRAVVAGTAARSVLGRAPAGEPQADALGPGSAGSGRLSADRTGQRVAAASRVVRQQRHGRSLGRGFRPGRGAQALRLPRPAARAQGCVVLASVAALARSVQRRFRRAALRSDQHLFRGQRRRSAGGRQAPARLQPRQAAGLPASGDRFGGHARRPAAGLRGAARQHRGQQDAAAVPEQDRDAIRQGAARLGDGSRRADRGGAGRDARQRSAGAISGGNAEGTPEPAGEASAREALAEGARGRRGQAAGPGRRALCLRPERRPRRQGARDAPAAAEMAVGAARQARRDERHLRREC